MHPLHCVRNLNDDFRSVFSCLKLFFVFVLSCLVLSGLLCVCSCLGLEFFFLVLGFSGAQSCGTNGFVLFACRRRFM